MTADLIEFERTCPKCGTLKPITDFARNRTRPNGRASYCRPCHNADLAAYRATPDGRAALIASQRRSNARRREAFQAAVATLSPADRERLGL